jgi:hypothetical protein
MRTRLDQLAKRIGKRALGPLGTTVAHDEIFPEVLHADLRHEPDPLRDAERARLGLLGRITAILCLIEVYGHSPNPEEFRACLAKHIAFWRQHTRKTRSDNEQRKKLQLSRKEAIEPLLWIISAGAPTTILTKLKLEPAPGWPAGVYFFGDDILRVGIVVASKLPRERSTLLVRLMAAGPLLPQAIKELGTLPHDAHERAIAEQILLDLQHALGKRAHQSPKEQEFIVVMHRTWEDARTEGRAETLAEGVLTVLRVRGIPVSVTTRKRILSEKNLERLKRWHERAIVATSIREVLDSRTEDRSSKIARPAAHKERNGRRSPRASALR